MIPRPEKHLNNFKQLPLNDVRRELIDFVIKNELTDILINRNDGMGFFIGKTGTPSGGVEIVGKPPRTSSTRKYVCPCCGMSVRATRTVRVACIDCNEQMIEV